MTNRINKIDLGNVRGEKGEQGPDGVGIAVIHQTPVESTRTRNEYKISVSDKYDITYTDGSHGTFIIPRNFPITHNINNVTEHDSYDVFPTVKAIKVLKQYLEDLIYNIKIIELVPSKEALDAIPLNEIHTNYLYLVYKTTPTNTTGDASDSLTPRFDVYVNKDKTASGWERLDELTFNILDYYNKDDADARFAPISHNHGNLQNNGTIGSSNNTNKNVVTNQYGQITTEDKPVLDANISDEGNSSNAVTSDGIRTYVGDKVASAVFDEVSALASDTTPNMDGTASKGAETKYARGDHVHPTDTSRSPADHHHGNLTSEGKIGGSANRFVYTIIDGNLASKETIGNITTNGAIGSTSNLPIITTTDGKLTTGSFGTGANTFCQGNDSRLSDARTPTSHASSSTTYGASSADNYGHAKATKTTPKDIDLSSSNIGTETSSFARGDHVHKHPTATKKTGCPTSDKSLYFGSSFEVTQFTSNDTGHISNATDRTITIPDSIPYLRITGGALNGNRITRLNTTNFTVPLASISQGTLIAMSFKHAIRVGPGCSLYILGSEKPIYFHGSPISEGFIDNSGETIYLLMYNETLIDTGCWDIISDTAGQVIKNGWEWHEETVISNRLNGFNLYYNDYFCCLEVDATVKYGVSSDGLYWGGSSKRLYNEYLKRTTNGVVTADYSPPNDYVTAISYGGTDTTYVIAVRVNSDGGLDIKALNGSVTQDVYIRCTLMWRRA